VRSLPWAFRLEGFYTTKTHSRRQRSIFVLMHCGSRHRLRLQARSFGTNYLTAEFAVTRYADETID
jgi:hypothetical protein